MLLSRPRHLPALLTLAIVGCNDYGTTPVPPPGAPSLELTPEQPTTLDNLRIEVTDHPGSTITRYYYAWFVDGLLVEEYEGLTIPSSVTAKGQLWEVTVTPFNGNLEGTQANTSVEIVNSPPAVSLAWETSPASTHDDLVALAEITDPDEDEVTLEVAWTRDGEPVPHDGLTVEAGTTHRGEVWTLTVTPNDGEDDGEPAELSITIENMAPTVGSVTISPDPAYTTTDLVAAAHDVVDPDGDEVGLTYDWYIGGSLVPDQHESTLDSTFFVKGEEVEVEVTPNDGLVDGAPERSVPITIQNSPPSASSAAIDPSEAGTTDSLSCIGFGFEDADSDPEGYLYTWFLNGAEHSSGPTLDSSATRRGDTVACVATPFDGEDEGSPVFSAPITIGNSPPTLAEVHLDPEDPRVIDTLSVSLGAYSDPDGDEVSFRYAWEIDGELIDADGETLDGSHFAKGQEIIVTVTPTDGMLDGPPVRSEPVTAVNTPPVLSGVDLGPSPAYTLDTLTATASATDADGDLVSFSYRWFINDEERGSDSATLSHSLTTKHDTVRVEITATDGEAVTAPLSASLTVRNSPPTAPELTLVPTSPVADVDDLVCIIDVDSDDDDGDDVSYTFSWTIDGVPITDTTTTILAGDTIPAHALFEGIAVCSAVPNDGDEDGPAGISAPVTVEGMPSPTPLGEFCGRTLPYFCGGNCTANTEAFSDNYCRMAGYTEAYSYTVHSSGLVREVHYYNYRDIGGPDALPTSCDQILYSSSYGTGSTCTCVSELVCI